MAWFWGTYVLGFLITVRVLALEIQDDIDRENVGRAKKGKDGRTWKSEDVFLVAFAGMIWYLIALFLVAKFLMFPRGFKSKFAREQEKLAKAEEAEARAAEAEENLRRMQDEVLRYLPHETPADTIRRLKLVAEGQRPDDENPPFMARSA